METLQVIKDSDARVIDGSISADGKILSGNGFTVTHEETGVYLVKFDKPFYFGPPSIERLEVENPYLKPYGYIAEVIGDVTTKQFKYFTYYLSDHDLVMKDIPISYFYVWGAKDPNE